MMSEREFDEVIAVNLRGVYQCSREAARQMMKQRCGRIISISSVAALSGRPGQCNYTAAKAGIVGFTKSLAREAGKFNVLANALFVGVVDTEMSRRMPPAVSRELRKLIPLQRVGQPEEVAGPCVFLGSDLSTYITGTTINVSGGVTPDDQYARGSACLRRAAQGPDAPSQADPGRAPRPRSSDRRNPGRLSALRGRAGLDSVDALEIVVAVEGEFGIRVEDGDMQEIRSVNSIVDLILSRQNRVEEVQ